MGPYGRITSTAAADVTVTNMNDDESAVVFRTGDHLKVFNDNILTYNLQYLQYYWYLLIVFQGCLFLCKT